MQPEANDARYISAMTRFDCGHRGHIGSFNTASSIGTKAAMKFQGVVTTRRRKADLQDCGAKQGNAPAAWRWLRRAE